jgi:hypothetical protein
VRTGKPTNNIENAIFNYGAIALPMLGLPGPNVLWRIAWYRALRDAETPPLPNPLWRRWSLSVLGFMPDRQ